MATKLPDFSLRNIGVSTFYLSLLTSGLLTLASLEKTTTPMGWSADNQFQTQQTPTPNKGLYTIGALLSLAVAGSHLKTRINNQELVDLDTLGEDTTATLELLIRHGIALGAELLGEGLAIALDTGRDAKKQLTQLAITAAPLPVRTALERMVDDKSWFEKFLKAPHNRIAGRTRSGKRFIASQLLIDFIERYPAAQVVICDPNFGKDGNDWMGIPADYIHSNLEAIDAAVRAVCELMLNRKTICEQAARQGRSLTSLEKQEVEKPLLLVVDELDSLNDSFKDAKNDKFIYHLKQILKQGGGANSGYRIKCLLMGQSLSVGGSGIDLALTDQMATCLTVGLGQLNTEQLSKLRNEAGDELADKALALTSKGIRAAVVQLDGVSQVVAIPDLSHLETFRFTQVDPDRIWWDSVWGVGATHPDDSKAQWGSVAKDREFRLWLLARQFLKGEINSPLKTEVVSMFGVKVRSDDVRYTKFVKPLWDAILADTKLQLERESTNTSTTSTPQLTK